MNFLRWIFLTGVFAFSAHAELPLLTDATHDPAWQELFSQLTPVTARQTTFEERRYFSFRKEPIKLTGEVRIEPGRGLSLSYLTPEPLVLIADEKGLLMRDGQGRERVPPSNDRAQAATGALIHVLRFDLRELEQRFAIHGRREGEAWTLAFVPREPELAAAFGSLTLSGERNRPQKIEIVRTPTQRIEISLGEPANNVIFTGEVLRRFFR